MSRSQDGLIEISDDEDGNETSSTNESIRIDLIQRIIRMNNEEIKITHSFVKAMKTTKKERLAKPTVPCGAAVKLEKVDIPLIKKEIIVEEATEDTIPTNPLTISQTNLFDSIVPTSTVLGNKEDAMELCGQSSAISDDNVDFDSDTTTEFESFDSKAIAKLEPSSCDTISDILAIKKEDTVERAAKRSLPHNQDITAAQDVRPPHHESKRQCLLPVDSALAVVPALRIARNLMPSKSNTHACASNMEISKTCIVCGCETSDLVDHYVREHHNLLKDSRISPDSRKLVRSYLLQPQFSADTGEFKQFCLFCERKMCHTKYGWTDHIFAHTGEDGFECQSCDMTLACRKTHEKLHKCTGRVVSRIQPDNNIFGFVCKLCDYAQVFESAIIEHIKVQHCFAEPMLKNEYQKMPFVYLRDRNYAPMLNNDWKDMYPTNPIMSCFCVICNVKIPDDLVDHYIKKHANAEVFISRISPKMKELAQRKNSSKPLFHLPLFAAYCLFCERSLQMNPSDWGHHLKSHTGEQKHCFKSVDECFNGYICNLCNYVQLSGGKLKSHVLNHHDVELADIYKNYDKISLLHLPPS